MSAPGRGLAALLVAAVLVAGPAPALEMTWFSIDGGGGTSAGGSFTLSGTVGQPDAGAAAGGALVLKGGFWAAPGLTATDAGEGPPVSLPPAHRLSAAAPNPFRAGTTLRFDLPRREAVRVRVYDVTGRLVRTLVDGELDSGSHDATWDGRDRGGSIVASGVYLVRLQAGSFGATRKVLRLD